MLSEPTADDVMAVCSEVPEVGLEVSRAVSRASLTLEGSLQCQDASPSRPTPMEVREEPLALEVATAEDPAPEGGADSYPAPEGVAGSNPALVGSARCNPARKGVQVGSFPHLHGRPCWVVSTSVRWGNGDACFHRFEQTSRLRGQ
jgi:hypothetical protein